jgi:class 3 adenylate cyclase
MGMENARLYHQLDGLFRATCPRTSRRPARRPEQAALGGAVVEVTALFADLRGFTSFSERSTPEEIVVMLNRYFEHATAAILDEGGTVVQFVGDALMALFNAPARQDDHPVARRGPRWPCRPRSRRRRRRRRAGRASGSGINTGPRWWATSAAPRCAASTRWATR